MFEDRNNPNHPGKPQPIRDSNGDEIPGYHMTEAHEEFDNLCKALIHQAGALCASMGHVKDPELIADAIVQAYEDTERGFFSVLLDDDIAEAAGLAQWRTKAAKAFADAFNAAVEAK